MDGAGCSAGRFSIHSAMVSFRGEALHGLLEELWQASGDGEAEASAWSCPGHRKPGQAGPEGQVGIPSLPGRWEARAVSRHCWTAGPAAVRPQQTDHRTSKAKRGPSGLVLHKEPFYFLTGQS